MNPFKRQDRPSLDMGLVHVADQSGRTSAPTCLHLVHTILEPMFTGAFFVA